MGIHMDLMGISWDFKWISREFKGISWNFKGVLLDFKWISYYIYGFHGHLMMVLWMEEIQHQLVDGLSP